MNRGGAVGARTSVARRFLLEIQQLGIPAGRALAAATASVDVPLPVDPEGLFALLVELAEEEALPALPVVDWFLAPVISEPGA